MEQLKIWTCMLLACTNHQGFACSTSSNCVYKAGPNRRHVLTIWHSLLYLGVPAWKEPSIHDSYLLRKFWYSYSQDHPSDTSSWCQPWRQIIRSTLIYRVRAGIIQFHGTFIICHYSGTKSKLAQSMSEMLQQGSLDPVHLWWFSRASTWLIMTKIL